MNQHVCDLFFDQVRVLAEYFADEEISEVMVNAPDDIWIDRRGQSTKVPETLTSEQVRGAITYLASLSDKRVGNASQQYLLSAKVPNWRVEAMLPPVAVKGPSLCMRRHARRVLTMDDYVKQGVMTREIADILVQSVQARENILIAGGTGTGKTTFLNALIGCVQQDHRLFVIETVAELKIPLPNCVQTEADDEQGVSSHRLVKVALRYKPDRIILGEVRGGEAYDLLDAANSGHPGSFGTLHADGAKDAISRFENLVLMGESGLPYQAIRARIADTFDLVVAIERMAGSNQRRLSEIVRIHGFDHERNDYLLSHILERN